ncbi:MAG: hypothetical protein ACOX6V_00715 [Patescibacteria group bacterium]|jgi:ABC-type sugar transport system ATPase subunit
MADRAYDASDMEQLYKHTHARSWGELAQFARDKGEELWHVTKEEAHQMADDIARLEDKGVEFTNDPHEAYDMVKEHMTQRPMGTKHGEAKAQREEHWEEKRKEKKEDKTVIEKILDKL